MALHIILVVMVAHLRPMVAIWHSSTDVSIQLQIIIRESVLCHFPAYRLFLSPSSSLFLPFSLFYICTHFSISYSLSVFSVFSPCLHLNFPILDFFYVSGFLLSPAVSSIVSPLDFSFSSFHFLPLSVSFFILSSVSIEYIYLGQPLQMTHSHFRVRPLLEDWYECVACRTCRSSCKINVKVKSFIFKVILHQCFHL